MSVGSREVVPPIRCDDARVLSLLVAAAVALGTIFEHGLARAQAFDGSGAASPSGEPPAAPAGPPLTLGEVLASVEVAYPLLDAARSDLDAAEAEQLAADGAFDPLWRTRTSLFAGGYGYGRIDTLVEEPTPLWGMSFFVGYRYCLGKIHDYHQELETLPYGELRAGVQVPLWRNGPIDRRRASMARADLGRDIADLGIVASRLEAVRLASVRYAEWVAAGQRMQIARTLLEIATTCDAQVAARAARGNVPALERVENQRLMLQREAALVAAERSLVQASLALSLDYRGADGRPRVPAASRLPAFLPEPRAIGEEEARRARRQAETRRPEPQRFDRARAGRGRARPRRQPGGTRDRRAPLRLAGHRPTRHGGCDAGTRTHPADRGCRAGRDSRAQPCRPGALGGCAGGHGASRRAA